MALNNAGIAESGAAVTPSDSTQIRCMVLYVGGAGTVAVEAADGTALTFVGVPAGSFIPLQCRRVLSTGTTATSIVALY
jgi:hypothetical protein